MFKKILTATAMSSLLFVSSAFAADYKFDIEGQHASINFKVSHLGMSWMYGSFKDFDGSFSYDAAKPEASKVNVVIKTNRAATNPADRHKRSRRADFLNVSTYAEAGAASTSVQ